MSVLQSYVRDTWWSPSSGATPAAVYDATTGALVAEVSTDGLDLAAVVEHARTVGRPALQAMTIHSRALLLKQLASYLMERKLELYELSYATGATARDHFFDIDGGFSTLFTFSSKGRRELANSNVVIEPPLEILSKDGSFLGEHVLTALPGVAVQVNAFNFPVWGMLEKFAPAFVAGVPTIVKPATPTAFVTRACVAMMVESGLLPDGSLQLVTGSAGDLMDHLDHRDHLAFTGSAATARRLQHNAAVTERGLRFTAETDSLNAAILGPDAVPGTPEFAAFTKAVVTELTSKAGQKCTAIRRVLVPDSLVDATIDAVTEMLGARHTVGDPRADSTTVGALCSTEQRDEVAAAVAQLVSAGGTIRLGGPDAARPETGAFYPVTLLSFADVDTPAVHQVEAFGPVASVLGYRDIPHAIELAAQGGGSLVATLCSHDPEVVRQLTMGLAGHHGRLHILDRDDAKSSTGHGSPLPHLIHGGPGRAGGGEELGGIRGIAHYMTRTALQGSPDMLTAITGVWHPGAVTQTVTRAEIEAGTGIHPFRKSLAELRIGDQLVSEYRTVTLADIEAFAESTGDRFYAHTDPVAAAANPFFPRQVAHGYLLVSWAAGLFVDPDPGPVLANAGLENLRFITPVTWDDAIRVTLTAKQVTPRLTEEYGEVRWDTVIHNQHGEVVATYDVLTLVAKTQEHGIPQNGMTDDDGRAT